MNRITSTLIALLLLTSSLSFCQEKDILDPSLWRSTGWEFVDSLGNHRVVLNVDKEADAVLADIPWRMREIGPAEKDIVVVDSDGNRQMNVYPFENSRDRGVFAFEPGSGPGLYYVYYLTYRKSGSYYPSVSYHEYRDTFDPTWAERCRLSRRATRSRLPVASLVAFESVNDLNSFYPMEIFASDKEVEAMVEASNENSVLIFTEGRENPVKSTQFVPLKWTREQSKGFSGRADRGEYYTFQVALFASRTDLKDV